MVCRRRERLYNAHTCTNPPIGADELEVATAPPSETSTVVDAGLGSMYQCTRRLRSHVH